MGLRYDALCELNRCSEFDNRAQKKLTEISSWENKKKATIEAELKKIEVKSLPSSFYTSMKLSVTEILITLLCIVF